MKKKFLLVVPICAVALVSVFAVCIYAADVNSKAGDIDDQAAVSIEYDKIPQIADEYKAGGKVLTEEQLQKLDELYKNEGRVSSVKFPYKEGVITGEIDPDAPKLDLATAKDIIAKSNDDISKIHYEFAKVQKYPDVFYIGGITVSVYFLNEYETIAINGGVITYQTLNPDGSVKSQNLLRGYGYVYGKEDCPYPYDRAVSEELPPPMD